MDYLAQILGALLEQISLRVFSPHLPLRKRVAWAVLVAPIIGFAIYVLEQRVVSLEEFIVFNGISILAVIGVQYVFSWWTKHHVKQIERQVQQLRKANANKQ